MKASTACGFLPKLVPVRRLAAAGPDAEQPGGRTPEGCLYRLRHRPRPRSQIHARTTLSLYALQLLAPGTTSFITTVTDGEVRPVRYRYVVSDYYHSEMSEYDTQYVFVPLKHLQLLRNMDDRVTAIQIRLKDYNQDA